MKYDLHLKSPMKYDLQDDLEVAPIRIGFSTPYPLGILFIIIFVVYVISSVVIILFVNIYPKTSINFIVMGDYGGFGNENQTLVAKNMGKWCSNNPCDFILTTGDNFYPNGTSSFNDQHFNLSFENVYNDSSISNLTWYAILGNHDWKGWPFTQIQYTKNQKNKNRWYMPNYYYNFTQFKSGLLDKVGVNFIMMDTTPMIKQYEDEKYNQTEMATQNVTTQLEWIRNVLDTNDNSKYPWKILTGHHCAYGYRGKASVPGFIELIRDIKPLMVQYNSKITFSGHDHNIQVFHDKNHSDIYHFLSGAGSGTKIKESPPHPYHIYTLFKPSFLYVKIFQYYIEVKVIGPFCEITKTLYINF